jgi:hypothetical protein
MRKAIFLLTIVGCLGAGMLLSNELVASSPRDQVAEKWVNANLLRVQVNGRWEEVPMVPLADHLCQSRNRMFRRYCTDSIFAPSN